jgi:hypothetical protein
MLSAFSAAPLTYIAFKLEGSAYPDSALILSAVQLFGTVLFVALTLYLKKFLGALFQFHATNRLIDMMIMANISAGIFVVLAQFFPQLKDTLSVAVIIIVIFQGIVQIQFGYMLLKLPDDLGGMLKPFCYANMLTGICVASVVFILVGVVASAIADLMLGTIFLQIAKQLREADTKKL